VYIRVQPASQPSDREEVYRFRYRVQAAELGRPPADADQVRGQVRDGLDAHARILAAVDEDTGAVLGTLRTLLGRDRPYPPDEVERLDLSSMIVAFGDERIGHSGMFMVDPAYRGQTVASQLLAGLVRTMLDEGVWIDVCRVELAQARSWFQLGYRPYGPMRPAAGSGELEVPLALVLRDRAYLERVGSPLLRLLGPGEPDGAGVAQRLRELYPHFEDQAVTPQRLGAFWASVAHTAGAAREAGIFEGIPQEQLDPILRELPTVRVKADRPLPPGGEHEGGLGLILRGRLGLTMEQGERPFFVTVLQPGEVFGTLQEIPVTPPGARLRALEDTEIIVLPAALITRLQHQDPLVALRLRTNLGGILAARLDATHRQVAGFMRGSPERLAVQPGEPDEPPSTEPAPLPVAFAEPVVQLEAETIALAGLPDGTLLDPCAGTGAGTRLLARLQPRARVVGVEADPARLEDARIQAEAQGLADHCTYLAGPPDRLPLDRDTVDGVYLRLALHRQAEPAAVLSELDRVLRPGGRVVVLEIDDGGLMVHPEPPGFAALQRALAGLQRQLGGDRQLGRKLPALLDDAGLDLQGCELIPLTPADLPLPELLALVMEPRRRLLQSMGALDASLDATLDELRSLDRHPGAWIALPLILAWADKPATSSLY